MLLLVCMYSSSVHCSLFLCGHRQIRRLVISSHTSNQQNKRREQKIRTSSAGGVRVTAAPVVALSRSVLVEVRPLSAPALVAVLDTVLGGKLASAELLAHLKEVRERKKQEGLCVCV